MVANVDGRVYNLVVRAPGARGTGAGTSLAGTPQMIARAVSLTQVKDVPLLGSFYRIHTNRSLLSGTTAGSTPADKTCQKADATRQIGCLVQASPCSLGVAAGEASDENPGTKNLWVNGVSPTLANIQNLMTDGFAPYPIARKLYVNSLRGFDNPLLAPAIGAPVPPSDQTCVLPGSGACTVAVPSGNPQNCDLQSGTSLPQCCCDDSYVGGPDRESELVSCIQAALPGFILSNRGFFPLANNAEYCEDFNEAAVCNASTNVDACAGNTLIPAGNCSNNLIDGAETDKDCGGPTCTPCQAQRRCVKGSDCVSGDCTGFPGLCAP